MGLADRLAASTDRFCPKTTCQTCRFLVTLSDTDYAAVIQWVESGDNMAGLWRECVNEGLRVQYRNFMWHFEKGHDVAR